MALDLSSQAGPRRLDAEIYALPGANGTRIVASLPPATLRGTNGGIPGLVVHGDVTWTRDGRSLLFSTGPGGEGFAQVAGIWEVSARGGVARLLIGTPNSNRSGIPQTGSPLGDASHWAHSPDRMKLAADPQSGMWIAADNGAHARTEPISLPPGCMLAQYAWLHDSLSLAYLQLCSVPSSPAVVQSTLYVTRLDTRRTRRLVHVLSRDLLVVDIGRLFRCVLCGGQHRGSSLKSSRSS